MSWPVLVVDDDKELREALVDILSARGLRAFSAGDGAEALAWLRRGPTRPAVILLDLRMPVLDGRAFLEQVASDPQLGSIPVVAITAQPDLADQVRDAVLAVVQKPIDLPRLLALVREAFEGKVTGRVARVGLAKGSGPVDDPSE